MYTYIMRFFETTVVFFTSRCYNTVRRQYSEGVFRNCTLNYLQIKTIQYEKSYDATGLYLKEIRLRRT